MTQLIVDRTQKPYYDFSKSEVNKGYISVLSVAGRTLQNRELNSISGLMLNHIKNVGDVILTTGTVTSGCSFYSDENKDTSYLSEGKIYYNGIIINTPVGQWQTSKIDPGICYICYELIETAVTEIDDKTLYDPAENYENYNEPGSYRLLYEVIPLIYTEDELKVAQSGTRIVIDIIKLYNRQIVSPTKPKPVLGKVYDMMAYRTFDESGNFLVRGLKISTAMNINTTQQYRITLSEGRAYVKGYEYNYDSNYIITKSAIDTRKTDINESHQYLEDVDTYTLFHANVKQVNKLICQVIQEKISINRGTTISDSLNISGLISVNKIYQGDYTYLRNVDYVINGLSITWLKNNMPSTGSTYYIDIVYKKNFIEGVDYITSIDNNNFTKFTLITPPAPDTQMEVDYTWFISRYDLVYIDVNGLLKVINGNAGEIYEIDIPEIPLGVLPIGYILVEPGKDPSQYKKMHYNIYRVTVADQRTLMSRVDNIEYNITMTALENDMQSKHSSKDSLTNLKGIFVDSFTDYVKSDVYNLSYSASIDIFNNIMKLGISTETVSFSDLNINPISSVVNNSGIITLPFTTIEAEWQKIASDVIDINKNEKFSTIPKLYFESIQFNNKINIDSNNFFDYNIILPMKVMHLTTKIREWVYGLSQENNYDTVTMDNVKINYLKSLSIPIISDDVIILRGENFTPYNSIEDNQLRLYFDGVQLTSFEILSEDLMAPSDEASLSVNGVGNFKCSKQGTFKIAFALPIGTIQGNKEITIIRCNKIINEDNSITWHEVNEMGTIYYKTNGYYREYERITDLQDDNKVTNTFYLNSFKQRPIYIDNLTGLSSSRNFDPISQTFSFSQDMFINKLDLYFKSKPNISNRPSKVYISIREVVNNEPSGPILYEHWLNLSDIKISSVGAIVTNVAFDYPIYCQSGKNYAFSLNCPTSGYEIWYAKVNQYDISSKSIIQVKPYGKGNLYVSDNASTWTLIQDAALKFSIHVCEFETEGVMETLDYAIDEYAMLNTYLESSVMEGTDLKYKYKIGTADISGLPIREKIVFDPNSLLDDEIKIKFRFEFSTNNKKISPVINWNTFNTIFAKYNTVGSYIMRSFSFSE